LLQSTIDQYEADEIAKYTIEIGFRRYPDDIVVYIDLSVERQRGLLASTEQSIVETIPQFNETYILEVVYTELGIPLDYLFEDHRTLRNSAPSTLQAQRSDASDLDDSREQDTPATAASDPQPGSLGGPIGTDEITTVTDATPPQAIRRPRTPSNFWGRALAIGMGLVGIFVGAGCGIAAIRNPEKRSDRLWQLSLMITPASTTAIYAIILR